MSFSALPQRCRLTPSFSLPDINDTFGSIWNPNLLEHAQVHHPPKVTTFVTAFNALRVQISCLKHRIYDIETENNELRHTNMVLLSDSQALEQELSNFRADYYTERFQSKVRVQSARADKDKIVILTNKLEQAEKFIMAMVDIKLHEPVLGRAAEAVREGADAEEALIDAVRVAATKKGSAWSRIIPAIVGPRSPEHYLSAINLALRLQKDLHESEKVSSFWKTLAKLDPVNADTITPSPSLLSEVGGRDVEHSISEQAVLDEMIALLTNDETLAENSEVIQLAVAYSAEAVELVVAERELVLPSMPIDSSAILPVSSFPTTPITGDRCAELMPTKAPQTVNIAAISPPMHTSQVPVSPVRSKAKAPQIAQSKLPSPVSLLKVASGISPTKQVGSPTISSGQPTTPIRKAPLTPICSRLSTPRTNTFRRPALTTIDINRPPTKMNASKILRKPMSSTNVSQDNIRKTPSANRDRSQTLVKRRGVIMEEISHPPPSIIAKNEKIVLPMTAEIEIYEPRAPPSLACAAKITKTNTPGSTSVSTEDISPFSPAGNGSSSHCTESDLSENVAHGPLLATQALLSLERICAAFSSDSLGSLEMSDEGANDSQSDIEDLLSTNERDSNVVLPASLTNLTHTYTAVLDLECSMASDSSFREDVNLVADEGPQASESPRPPTPIVKCSTWASSTPRRPSTASSSGSISISIHQSKKPFKPNESPPPARTSKLASKPSSPTYPTDKRARLVKDTFYKAVPPSQNVSLLPIKQTPDNGCQQLSPPSQNKVSQATFPNTLDQRSVSSGPSSFPCKPRSQTINVVSPLPPNLSTPLPESMSTASPSKPRSDTVTTISPMSPTRRGPRPECNKQRSNTIRTIVPVDRPHTAKAVSSSARRRSNTLDSYLPVPSKNIKNPVKTRAVSFEDSVTVPAAAFMRRPDVKTTAVNTRKMTNYAAPLIPNGCPVLPSSALSPIQYRNMLRGDVNMVVR